jgi:mediator of RNA polymerase II transcription subunit 23
MKLYDLLYSDTEVIPMADVNKAQSTHRVASTCIWIHLNKKAQTDKVKLPRPIPYALQEHQSLLTENIKIKIVSVLKYDHFLSLKFLTTRPHKKKC